MSRINSISVCRRLSVMHDVGMCGTDAAIALAISAGAVGGGDCVSICMDEPLLCVRVLI